MSQQYNKVIKRARRKAYHRRRKDLGKATARPAKPVAPRKG